MTKKQPNIIGNGVYALADVARLTKLNPARVRSWFVQRTDVKSGPVFRSDYKLIDGATSISFADLMDVRVAAKLRELGVSMPTIRKAYEVMKVDLKTDHPFSHKILCTDGKEIFMQAAAEMQDGGGSELVNVITRQQLFKQIAHLLEHVEFDNRTKMAARWNIHNGVVIDPGVGFGHPVIKGTGTSTRIVSGAYFANQRNAALVADLYKLSRSQVDQAVKFEEWLGRRSAA